MLTMRRSGVGADGGRVEVVSRSVGQQLRRLLARPTAGRLREAVPDAQTGRSAEVEQLAVLLLAADRSAAGEVLASAAELLLSAAPSLWLSLDVAARRSWWNAPPWADTARRPSRRAGRVSSRWSWPLSIPLGMFARRQQGAWQRGTISWLFRRWCFGRRTGCRRSAPAPA